MKPETRREIDKINQLANEIIELIRNNKAGEANDKCEDIHSLIETLVLDQDEKTEFKKELEEISKKLKVAFQVTTTLEAEATNTLKSFLFKDQTYDQEDID